MASTSLKKEIRKSSTVLFPEVFISEIKNARKRLFDRLNSKSLGLLVIPATFLGFLLGQFFHPSFLQIINIPETTAHTIIDQRAANLATIFSITLVVIGWLLTNISIKESISYQMLFKHTYLYPIFYFIVSLIGCLIAFSLLRHIEMIDMGNIVIAGTALILFALVLIVFLFVRLIAVVDVSFYYTSLEKEVMPVVHKMARPVILGRRSRKAYQSFCEELGFRDGIRFMTDLTSHTGININPQNEKPTEPEADPLDIVFPKISKRIIDVDLHALSVAFKDVTINTDSYYRPLQVDSNIPENYHPLYLASPVEINEKKKKKIRKAFKLGKLLDEENTGNDDYLSRLHERFLRDVKEGKKENMEQALKVYSKIYDLENQIIKEC